jgi:hypothetical protein
LLPQQRAPIYIARIYGFKLFGKKGSKYERQSPEVFFKREEEVRVEGENEEKTINLF